jgi:predicted ArsR family transcriptional regulator
MTEPVEPAGTGAAHRGRPRPQDTINRDEKVYQLLSNKGPLTRTQIAEELGVTPGIAYMSLFRLKKEGYVERGPGTKEDARSNTWQAVSKA